MTVDWWVVEWAFVFVALFGAVLVVIRILEGKPKTQREVSRSCGDPGCNDIDHLSIVVAPRRHIPSIADAFPVDADSWMDAR